ncbi:hypothetical protein HanRHA438_Chr15g0735141 [Helianthus annuus]|nr:hypothetical protein HanIR_Chr15g0786451 [Helianthus annuus]KAJ0847349.1 hypothetical protein HanRHA438_Chr15g0735141 [Helianthus annuus]
MKMQAANDKLPNLKKVEVWFCDPHTKVIFTKSKNRHKADSKVQKKNRQEKNELWLNTKLIIN